VSPAQPSDPESPVLSKKKPPKRSRVIQDDEESTCSHQSSYLSQDDSTCSSSEVEAGQAEDAAKKLSRGNGKKAKVLKKENAFSFAPNWKAGEE